ncbi:MAG: glycoside hydrolase family 3 C-terminal domain-containing protein [Erysipelotrichaceae bacterium]|nr:glycoside hydrolase family 3 C-terminal domain-containing protein [Erysipelotrichaceae bacterium]
MKRVITGQYDDKVSVLERENREVAYKAAVESFVLLKNDGCLPLKEKEVALFGAGATHTIKGGTGSGEVNNRHSVSIYEGLKDAGLTLSSDRYLRSYIANEAKAHEEWIKANTGMPSANSLSHNYKLPEPAKIEEDDLSLSNRKVAIYVVSRQSGEAADKKLSDSDYNLKENEIANIGFLYERFDHLIVIVNSGSSMDLSPLDDLNISLIFYGQAGQEGGRALADVLTGKEYFSGKLTSTWAKRYEDIPFGDEFSYLNGDLDNEYYKEDIYVGYRYFDSFKVEPRFHFGYGLTYTDFKMKTTEKKPDGRNIELRVKVKNTGNRIGKQVVQVYASCPKGRLDKEYQRLVAFAKTRELKPGEEEELTICFDMYSLASYDEKENVYLLEKGDYIIKVGESSADNTPVLVIENREDIILSRHEAICKSDSEYERLVNGNTYEYDLKGVERVTLDKAAFETKTYEYGKPAIYSDDT